MLATLTHRLTRRLSARKLRRGPGIVMTDFLGCQMLVRPREDVGRNMALGEFETDDLHHFIGAIRDGDVVFDIGANVGAYCIPIGKLFSNAKIYAFEPIPLNSALIEVSRIVNGLDGVKIIRKCVSDESGTVEFSLAEDSAYSSMVDTRRKDEIGKFTCDTVTLDEFCELEQIIAPDIVKIDVEGAELKVIQGASRVFGAKDRRPRLVLIELYEKNLSVFGTSIDDVVDWMSQWGYSPYVLISGSQVPFTREHHNIHYNVFFRV